MATKPTPNPAIMSMESAERKATRSVRMVADAHAFGRRLDLAPPLHLAAEGAQRGQPLDELEERGRPASRAAATGAPSAWSLPART